MEGEATFGYYGKTQRVAVEMTDEDTMIRVAVLLSKICGVTIQLIEFDRPHRINSENHSNMFRAQVTGVRARTIMRFVVGHMSSRRRATIWRALNGYAQKKHRLAELGIVIPISKETA